MRPDTAPGDVLRLKETYGSTRTPKLSGIFLRVTQIAPNGEPVVVAVGGRVHQLPRGTYKVVVKGS